MAHAHQQIFEAVAQLLAGGGTGAGSRVFLDRVDPLPASELPALVVVEDPEGDSGEALTLDDPIDERTLHVRVHCLVKHATEAAEQARALGLAVEKLLAPQDAFAALGQVQARLAVNRPLINGDGERLLAGRLHVWRFTYQVEAAAPDVIL